MLRRLSMLWILFLAQSALANEVLNGDWQGELYVNDELTLTLVFHLNTQNNITPTASVDSPDQSAYGIPVAQVKVNGNALFLDMPAIGATFHGVIQHSFLKGTFSQMGREFELEMRRLNDIKLEGYKVGLRLF